MSLLMQGETLFSFIDSLDPDFVPRVLPHREGQQEAIADCIRPLINGYRGRHVLVTGKAGIGKTATVQRMLADLREESAVASVFVNCWKKNSSFRILSEACHQLGYQFTHNLGTDEVLYKIKKLVGDKGIVFALDEVDKAQDDDFLYYLAEEIPRLVLVMITNDRTWFSRVDQRIRSRIIPEEIEFPPYSLEEMRDILALRRDYAFYDGTWSEDAFEMVVKKAHAAKDVRLGILLLRESGLEAEKDASRKVLPEHVTRASGRLLAHAEAGLDEDEKLILQAVKELGQEVSGKVYEKYVALGGRKSHRTFERKVNSLEEKGLLKTKKTGKGFRGQSTVISLSG